jgi:hypothetical protein
MIYCKTAANEHETDSSLLEQDSAARASSASTVAFLALQGIALTCEPRRCGKRCRALSSVIMVFAGP